MKSYRLYLFLLVAVAYLISSVIEQRTMVLITKPLLMPALAWWMVDGIAQSSARFLWRSVLAGLGFSTVGDVFMMFADGSHGALFFLLGLGAFLFTHLSYIGGFTSVAGFTKGFLQSNPVWVLPFLVFLCSFVWWLWPGIPVGMRTPVGIYAAVISTMVLSIVNLKGRVKQQVFAQMLFGGLLFMLSDSLIAAQKFSNSLQGAGLAIMITYIAGQFLIAKGVRETDGGR